MFLCARDDQILSLAPLVHGIASSFYRSPSIPLADLQQAGWIGAIQAVDKYDGKSATLQAYARSRIVGAIRDFCRSQDHLTRQQRHNFKQTGAEPPRHVREWLAVDVRDSRNVPDGCAAVDVALLVGRARLSPRWLIVLHLLYFEEIATREIGRRLRRTEGRISQIHAKALKKMRRAAELR